MSVPEFNEIIETNEQAVASLEQWEAVLKLIGFEPNDQTKARFYNFLQLRKLVGNVYPNKFSRSAISGTEDTITNILKYEPVIAIVAEIKAILATLGLRERPPAEIKDPMNARLKDLGNVRVSGRLTTPPRGNFVHLTDGINKLQIYAKKATFALVRNDAENSLDEENGWAAFGLLDHGDFIGVEGYLFITNTGELSVHVEKLQFLAKAMLPMPDKMHGIADPELQRRYRYADLIASTLQIEHEGLKTREVFERRAKLISGMRNFLDDAGFIEVETPMLTPKATGAAAKPFKTHHNALDIDLYARIAPELYLKRLVVGGFEKVYELNRNFRNEGISYKHNPEFTMLEFYCAYMDVEGMMNFCEELMRQSVQKATGGLTVNYEGNEIDFSTFERLSMADAIDRHWTSELRKLGEHTVDAQWFNDEERLHQIFALFYGIEASERTYRLEWTKKFGERERLSDEISKEEEDAFDKEHRKSIEEQWEFSQKELLPYLRDKSTSDKAFLPEGTELGEFVAKLFEDFAMRSGCAPSV